MIQKQRFQYLVKQFQQGLLKPEEVQELRAAMEEGDENQLIEEMKEMIEATSSYTVQEDEEKIKEAFNRIINIDTRTIPERKKTGKIRRLKMARWVAAASIIVLAGIGSYLFFLTTSPSKPNAGVQGSTDIVAPETNRAMITLVDGSKVYLDSANNGQLAKQGNIKLVKLTNGQIAYQTVDGQVVHELQYNTLTNPRGSKVIDMQLSDGSRVWLNAGSSVTYPVAFAGDERKVELTGEGYFEVAKDPSKKFIVTAGGTVTEVLGTHFNVRAYHDESGARVTLLEGSVAVKAKGSALKIRPGEQALVISTGITRSQADLDQVMAWKNGYFNFDGMNLKEVMSELERWYDIKVINTGKGQTMTFGGNINRNISLNDVLLILEKSGLRFNWDPVKHELTVF